MKQAARFFVKPGAFVNQLQWSTHHTLILIAFLVISGIEAHVGRQHGFLSAFASGLSTQTGIGTWLTTWLVVSLRMFIVLLGAYLVSLSVWFVGNFIGHSSSQRVLFRRLAVVFTLAMAAYTSQYLEHLYPWLSTASFFMYFWSALLGYFAIREQFGLTHLETAFVGAFAVLMVFSSWHYSNRYLETQARTYLAEVAAKSATSNTHKNLR